MRKFAVRTY